jgi:methyltransferase-like protein
MSAAPATSYDELPYGDQAFSHTLPDCLATAAALRGLQAPPPDRCRVLELGCARGGNLIPMAQTLAECRFVGIDLSPRQIATGRQVIDAIDLHNIELKAMSIMDVDASFGRFDYIICHGVYSWVPEPVQDKILDIFAANLTANGVAYVSYNIYPGWHLRGMVRDMLCFHARKFAEPKVRVRQGRAFLDFLSRFVRSEEVEEGKFKGIYGAVLKEEAADLAAQSDTYLFHEHLDDVNQPVYFRQFADRFLAKRLQYLGDARPDPFRHSLPDAAVHILRQLSDDPLDHEQYVDFLCRGTFRRTLLCHADVTLRPDAAVESVASMLVSGRVEPVAVTPDLVSNAPEEFRALDDTATLSTNRPLVKAALVHMAGLWPRSLSVKDLWDAIRSLLRDSPEPEKCLLSDGLEPLADVLMQLQRSNLVELHIHPPRCTLQPGERPVASPYARLQARTAGQITNLRHRRVELDGFARFVMRLLDGQHDRPAILAALAQAIKVDGVTIEHQGKTVSDPEEVLRLMTDSLEPCLHKLALNALLVDAVAGEPAPDLRER